MFSRPLVLLDIETTGLLPTEDCMIQIAACVLSRQKLLEQEVFFSNILPITPIRPSAHRVHGLTETDLLGAPPLERVLRAFNDFVPIDAILCGHNVSFDIGFLKAGYSSVGFKYPFDYHSVDIWSIAFFVLAARGIALESYTLSSLCSVFGIKRDRYHGAKQDVIASAAILRHLFESAKGSDMEILGQFNIFEEE